MESKIYFSLLLLFVALFKAVISWNVNYDPAILTIDSTCSISSISPTAGIFKSLQYITVAGSGYPTTNSSANTPVCIFDTQIGSRVVVAANIISSSQIKCYLSKNKDISTFSIYVSISSGTRCNSSTLINNTITIYYPPKIHFINIDATIYSNSKLVQILNFGGFHFNTFGRFDYCVNCKGYSGTSKIISSDDLNAQAKVTKISLSTSQSTCYIVPCSNPSISSLSSFNLLNIHFDGVDVYLSTLSYRIDMLIANNLVSFCKLTLYKSSSNTIGSEIDINDQQCNDLASRYLTLNSFAGVTAYYESNTLFTQPAPAFQTNVRINVTNSQMLPYLYGANWYCVLNNSKRLSFVDALWKLQDLNPYYKFAINTTNLIVYPGSIVSSTSQSTRSDAVSMVFTDINTQTATATCSCTYSPSSLDCTVCISSVSNFGKIFSLSLVDSNSNRIDDGNQKFVMLYQLPVVSALKLYARAHLVNGSYPVYPEFEFVQVTLNNPNNVDMQILETRCRTYRLQEEMNITFISSSTLVCKTNTALNIDDFCVQISIDNGITWSSDCSTQLTILQKEIDQILWKSQTFYREDNQLSVPFNLVCFWSVDPSQSEICVNIEDEVLCTNPLYSIYLSSQVFSTYSVPEANCNIDDASGDFSFYMNRHKVNWSIPNKILASGNRSNLKLFGSNFKEVTSCSFEVETGDVFSTTAVFIDLTYVECPLPDFSSIAFNNLMIKVLVGLPQSDGSLSNTSKIRIYLVQNPTLTSISPIEGFDAQQQDIIITGTNFYSFDSLHVKAVFTGYEDDMLINCLSLTNEMLIIKAPNALNIQLYNDRKMYLYVSVNGVDYTEEQIYYTFLDEPSIVGLSRYDADYQGNINIEVYGLHFIPNVTECAFGNAYVPATYNSATGNITCTAPPRDSYGDVQFKLVFYGTYEVNNTLIYFTYKNLNIIDDFTPTECYLTGGINVTVTGNFTSIIGTSFSIYFGTNLVTNYTFQSAYQLLVVAPPVTTDEDDEIIIIQGDLKYSTGNKLFYYKSFFQVVSIYPTSGPSRGDTVVEVTYSGTIDTMIFCKFGTKYSSIINISPERVDCKSPSNSPGTINVDLIVPDIYETNNGVQFSYNKDISVLNISPTAVPLKGGTTITVNGLNFLHSIKFKITEFGNLTDISEFVSSNQFKFIAPEQTTTGNKLVFMTNNIEDFYQRYDYPLLYYNNIYAISITPDIILIGSSTTVKIQGSGFISSDSIINYLKINSKIVEATYVDSETLTCVLPSFSNLTVQTSFEVTLTINLQDYYGNLKVKYILQPVINSFNPTYSSSYEQYFTVNVTGANFMDGSGLQCNLGSYSSYAIMYQTSSEILCFFSTLQSGEYKLKVSNNYGFDYTVAANTFLVIKSIQVTDIFPKLISSKGSIVFVKGSGFKSGIKCVFEVDAVGYTFNSDNIVDAQILNSNLIVCKCPDFSLFGSQTLLVRASLSNSLNLVSQSGVSLKIVDKPPAGYYAYKQDIIECPEGSFCPGLGNVRASHCPIGTYSDHKRSSQCKSCNRNLCPFEASSESQSCPDGYICDSIGLYYPFKPCTKGNFCQHGIQEYDKVNPSLASPLICDKNTYCSSGVKSGVTLMSNSTSSKACKRGFMCPSGSTSQYGIGQCPTGHYCPTPGSQGIPCPPRTYCPGRGNLSPIPCELGTFNYHYGQSNCTTCPIGFICPLKGLFSPVACPRGFMCNDEGLVYAYLLCRPGLICGRGVKSGVKIDERSCKDLEKIEYQLTQCIGGVVYFKSGGHYGLYLDGYGLNNTDYVCCWSSSQLMEYIPKISEVMTTNIISTSYSTSVHEYRVFGSYSTMFNQTQWDGMTLIDKALNHLAFNSTDKIDIPHRMHKNLLSDFMFINMYTKYKADLCPGGYICLQGCYTTIEDDNNISTPFKCPGGSYCLPGSGSIIGTGFCPAGFYCPAGSSSPIPTPKGKFTPTPGSISPIECYPGYFTLNVQSTSCLKCPNGFQCKGTGTSWPTICPVGDYRSSSESNACSLCPVGTFSFTRGAKDESECLQCPEGRLCTQAGLTNVTQSTSCSDGSICNTASGARSTISCPIGFYCPSGTGISEMYNNMCPAGFYCNSGTGDGSKYNKKCPEGYYCPQATEAFSDFTGSGTDNVAPTICPYSTGKDNEDGKRELTDCGINSVDKLLVSGNIRQSSSTTSGRRNLNLDLKDVISNSKMRSLSTSTTDTSTLLKDITQIEYSLHAYLDSNGKTTDTISSSINLSREYVIRWNPINVTFNSDIIFTIPSMSYALVVCDFRALQTEYENFTYYEDWGISFTIADSISKNDRAIPVQMPELFLRTQNVKNEVQEFQVFAWVTKQLRIDILLYNGLYINMKNMFLNTCTVEIREPYRTTYGSNNIFIALIQNSYQIGLPINAPQLRQDDPEKSPDYSVTLASNNNFTISKSVSNRVVTSRGKNIFVPDSLYWQNRDSINFPYFPFFSNCKGYGQYIPIWAVNEQNEACTLVRVNETIPMSEYEFSAKPNSDNCNSITIQCVYDEIFDDGQQSLTRWFEVQNQGSIYDINANPVSADEAVYYSVDQNSLLTFSPQTSSGGDLSNAPQEISLQINFYQYSETNKKIITVGFEFGNMKALTADEQNGKIDVPYNVTYSFSSMTHTELIIAFAFEWHFYFVLYLIIGATSITIALVFLLYHRLVARGKNLSFKFFSNLKLTEPPAIWGLFLAHIPLCVINLWMCVLMIGHVLTNKTELFPCDSSVAPAQCPFSIFDFMPDDPNNVSIDYSLLRTGRIAVSFIVVGAYCVVIGLIIVIPDKNIKGEYYTAESFDGNVWEFFTWKRSNVLLVSLFWIFFLLCIIQFSFSDIFALYIWYMIVTIKGLNIVIGFVIELMLEDSIVCSTLDILGGLTGGLVTFGASDFVGFLQSYYVEFGMQMFERTYLGDVTDAVLDFIKAKGEKLIEMKNSWFSNQDDIFDKEMKEKEERMKRKRLEQEEKLLAENTDAKGKTEDKKTEEKKGGEKKEEKKIEALDDLDAASSGSDIYISDEDDFDFDDSDNIDDSDQLVDYDNDSDANDKKKAEQKNKAEKDNKKGKKDKESDIAFDENIEVFEVEPILDKFKDYAGDNIELYINPLFTMILWLFYDETQIASSYGIRTQDFVYYVMFALVFIPFQIIIDMFFLNISEWFFKLPIHDYLDYLHFRFATRTSRWKGNEIVVNKQVEEENILLDQLCFSSQYYFIQTILVFGMVQLLLGINILLTFPSYNLFADMGILLVVVALIAVCFLIHRVCILLGHIFCIWKIKTVKTQKKETTLKDEFLKILNVEQYMKNKGIKLTPVELHFSPEKWDIVEKLRGQDEIALIDLQTDRIVAKTVRDKFIKYNKPWLRENMHEIFTPRTLFLYRKEIINQFEKVVGKRQPANISLSSKEKSTFSKEASGSKDMIFQRNFNPTLLNERTIPVIKFWIARAKNIKKIRRYVSRIIDSSMDKECMFCGSTFGLMVKTLENIEDTFHDFLKITGYSIANYKVVVWQRYFKIATTFKTVCSVGECADENRINFRNMQVLAKQNANKSKV